MIPSPTKEPLVQRLVRELTARLAAQAHCCPIHGIRLVCAVCEVASTASRSEEVEIEGLLERTALYQLPWQAWPCARCGAQDIALCLDCYAPVADQAFVGLTPDEAARYAELLIRTMRYTFLPELGDDGRGR
jgi:hypothetical protein